MLRLVVPNAGPQWPGLPRLASTVLSNISRIIGEGLVTANPAPEVFVNDGGPRSKVFITKTGENNWKDVQDDRHMLVTANPAPEVFIISHAIRQRHVHGAALLAAGEVGSRVEADGRGCCLVLEAHRRPIPLCDAGFLLQGFFRVVSSVNTLNPASLQPTSFIQMQYDALLIISPDVLLRRTVPGYRL